MGRAGPDAPAFAGAGARPNVYPREVEEALLAHPAVTGAAVVGAPDGTWVEAVTAFVTLRPGASASEDELR